MISKLTICKENYIMIPHNQLAENQQWKESVKSSLRKIIHYRLRNKDGSQPEDNIEWHV